MTELFKDDNHCFACGDLNPEGLHMKVDRNNGRAKAEVTLRQVHQGWRDMAHGGMVSTILDEIMAHAVVDKEPQAATVEMTVRFRSRVPLDQALITEGWIVRRDKRRIMAQGLLRLKETDKVLARSEAKFLIPKGC
jgi:acyl-coenzyme A thioesterase PaaI-like protein